ncbi:MAG: hypothetical protein MJ086_05795 [Lachnospiraceae bacterium]|nr:hypothetical protein [Lachnospiraceae bacterium]
MGKKISCLVLAFVMCLSLLPMSAFAATESPVEGPVPYLAYEDGNFVTRYCEEYTYLETWAASNQKFHSGWYVLNGGVTELPATVVGDCSIILLNDADCYFAYNIEVTPGSTLRIYAQPAEQGKSTGKLKTGGGEASGDAGAGIGGSYIKYDDVCLSCGDVYIYGGILELQGGEGSAGIGGSDVNEYSGDGGNVYIFGGDVTATGGNYAPGIGGGACEESCGSGGTLYVYGGKLTANGGQFAAGIGGGASEDAGGDGGDVHIYGGTVYAYGGEAAAGIGGGTKTDENLIYSDAGEGGDGGLVEITGGTVYAYGASASGSRDEGGGAGIGGGQWGEGGMVDITGGTVYAYGGYGAAGIGGGTLCDGASVNISSESAETLVHAEGGKYGAGIGGGNEGDGNPVFVYGGTVEAIGGGCGAGIGGGNEGDGFLFSLEGGYVEANGGYYAAGIGGGNKGDGGEVYLDAGLLTVYSGASAYAIGAGDGNNTEGNVYVEQDAYVYDRVNYPNCTLVNPDLQPKDWNEYFLYKDYIKVEIVSPCTEVDYISYNSTIKDYSSYTTKKAVPLVNEEKTLTNWYSHWYVVDRDITVDDVITVQGNATLILKNGCTLTANKGIHVVPGSGSLTIYAQSADETEMGQLISYGADYCAGIGGINGGSHGAIIIDGGYVEANGGYYAAGIGGGKNGNGGSVTVNSGKVVANGGSCGAGIGGGDEGNGGTVTVNYGQVEANGGSDAAGIGGGFSGNGGTVIINGGEIEANGVKNGAGIGGGINGVGANIKINGNCTVKAEAGEKVPRAIGGGGLYTGPGSIEVAHGLAVIDNMTGDVRASGAYETDWMDFLSGEKADFVVEINKTNSFYVFDGTRSEDLSCTNVTFDAVVWTDPWYVVTDDCTIDSVVVSGNVNLILQDGCKLTVDNGIRVEQGSNLKIYAQSTAFATMGKLTATSNADGYAGIGGGPNKASGNITFYGGYVIGNGGRQAAGIGGGSGGAGTVTIYGGTVFGNGGESKELTITDTNVGGGAGIGGGYNASGTVKIYGGKVNAHGGNGGGAGIGGGAGQNGGCNVLIDGAIDVTAYGGANAYVARAFFINKSIDVGPGIGGGAGSKSGTIEMKDGKVYAMAGENKFIGKLSDGEALKAPQIIMNPYVDFAIKRTPDGSDKSTYYLTKTERVKFTDVSAVTLETVMKINGMVQEEEPSDPEIPVTGDESLTGLWTILMLVSAMGLAFCILRKKRSH